MLAAISSLPETGIEQFLTELIKYSEEPLTSALKSLNLKNEHLKTPKDLILFLMTNKDKFKYPEEAISKAIANLIFAKNIPGIKQAAQSTTSKESKLWILWIIIGASLLTYIIIKKKKKKQ
jgi:hypothetical protein